jgi:hypothetical protein
VRGSRRLGDGSSRSTRADWMEKRHNTAEEIYVIDFLGQLARQQNAKHDTTRTCRPSNKHYAVQVQSRVLDQVRSSASNVGRLDPVLGPRIELKQMHYVVMLGRYGVYVYCFSLHWAPTIFRRAVHGKTRRALVGRYILPACRLERKF